MKTTITNRQGEKMLTATLYGYVEPHLLKHAKEKGKAKYGSASALINELLAKDAKSKASIDRMKRFAKGRKVAAKVAAQA
jgi:hypothetical protein